MEAHATVARDRRSGDRLESPIAGASFAVDRVHIQLDDTVRSETRNYGVGRRSPLGPECCVELVYPRVQVRHEEPDVKNGLWVAGGRKLGFPVREGSVSADIQRSVYAVSGRRGRGGADELQ
jgi:hypothetical protein